MPALKPCTHPGCDDLKMAGHPRWCREHWYLRQTARVQGEWAHQRAMAVPLTLTRRTVPAKDWPDGRRWCSGCQSFVRLDYVPKGASRCRACHGAAARNTYTKTTYGITKAEEDAILADQGDRCPICLRQAHTKRYAVDHNHATMEVRGLLDPGERGCNVMLGMIEGACQSDEGRMLDMIERLRAYVMSPPARRTLARLREGYTPPVEKIPF